MSYEQGYTISPYTGEEYDANDKDIKWHIIITSENMTPRQVHFDLQYTPENEIDFIEFIFIKLLKAHSGYLYSLVKISTCQIREKDKDQDFLWHSKRDGKWYFNPDVNDDRDTKFWFKKRNEFIQRLDIIKLEILEKMDKLDKLDLLDTLLL
jgi:hypothetical protein